MVQPNLSENAGYGEQFDVEGLNFFRRLLAAAQNGEFVVYFQPKVSISDLRVAGAEALVRWNCDGEILPPIKFIPFCERTGLVIDVDFFVLEETCRKMREWMDKGIELVRISVNFSKYHFNETGVAEKIYRVIRSYGIPSEYIEVEFTETAYLDKEELLEYTVDKLRSYGIKSSIDDFGSGYSSLNLLQNMDFEVVKLDKSLLGKGVENEKARKVISNIIKMAKELEMEVLAEGVETPEELKLLRDLKCDIVQGFLFDRPLPANEFEKRLRKKVYPAGYFGINIEREPMENKNYNDTNNNYSANVNQGRPEEQPMQRTFVHPVNQMPNSVPEQNVPEYGQQYGQYSMPEQGQYRRPQPQVQQRNVRQMQMQTFAEGTNKYVGEAPEEKKGKKGIGFMIAGIILFVIAVTVLGIAIAISSKNRVLASISTPTVTEETKTYSQEEVDEFISEACRVSGEEAATEMEGKYLSLIKEATSLDGGTSNLLKSLYPDDVVFADGSRYVYVPIDRSLKPNALERDRFTMDTETGFLSYENKNGETTSHLGIDVSRHQGVVDWQKVAASGVEFAIIKCGIRGYGSEGNFAEDSMFQTNMAGAIKAGLKVGVYFVTQAVTIDEAVEEAEWVLERISKYNVKCPVAIDVEFAASEERTKDLTPEERTTNIIYFCDTIKDAGYIPMIYANTKYFIRKMDMSRLEDYDKWYANYNSLSFSSTDMSVWQFNDPLYFPYEISMWQYTATATVDGIEKDTDLNIIFDKWW